MRPGAYLRPSDRFLPDSELEAAAGGGDDSKRLRPRRGQLLKDFRQRACCLVFAAACVITFQVWHPPHPASHRPAAGSSSSDAADSGTASHPAAVPFVLLFESSSGSSWLMQELSAMPPVCAIGFAFSCRPAIAPPLVKISKISRKIGTHFL